MDDRELSLRSQATLALRRKQYLAAAARFETLATVSDNPRYWQRAAEAYRLAGQYEDATKRYLLAIALCVAEGLLRKAIALCRKALEIHPTAEVSEVMVVLLDHFNG